MTYLTKKTTQSHDSFYKLNEKEVPLPNANPSIEVSNTQSNTQSITSDNEILESSEEEPRNFDKTSNIVIGIQTPTLQKSLSYENVGTPQDIRNIRVQFSLLKSHAMCELSSLNQKISSLSENLEKAVNDMKVQDRNVDLLHENIKILQNELSQKNEIIKSLMEIQLTVFDSLSAGGNDQTEMIISDQQQQQHHQQQQEQQQSQQMLGHNKQTIYEQHQQQTQQNQHTQNKELHNNNSNSNNNFITVKKTQQQQLEPKNQNRSIYAGNLHISVTEKDLYNFFGLRSTKYLQETCKVDLPLCKRTDKSKGYAFLNVPGHVYSEIVKLNGVEFKS